MQRTEIERTLQSLKDLGGDEMYDLVEYVEDLQRKVERNEPDRQLATAILEITKELMDAGWGHMVRGDNTTPRRIADVVKYVLQQPTTVVVRMGGGGVADAISDRPNVKILVIDYDVPDDFGEPLILSDEPHNPFQKGEVEAEMDIANTLAYVHALPYEPDEDDDDV